MRRTLPLLAVLVLAGCTSEPGQEATVEETTVVIEGATGTHELTGAPAEDIADLGVENFDRDWARETACEPPEDGQVMWQGQLRDITRQQGDWDAGADAIRITVHYDCPQHYDAVDEALG